MSRQPDIWPDSQGWHTPQRKPKAKRKPKDLTEKQIQQAIVARLVSEGYLVRRVAGGALMRGFPDLWVSKANNPDCWIEVKKPSGSKATPAQRKWFPRMADAGAKIWVLTSANDCAKLEGDPNWREFYG
jgi:hypothetical protein